jgi:hypothetical protein
MVNIRFSAWWLWSILSSGILDEHNAPSFMLVPCLAYPWPHREGWYILWNVSLLLPHYMVLHHRRQLSPGWGSLKRDSNLWSWVLWDVDPRVTGNCTEKWQTRPLIRKGDTQHEDCKCPPVIQIWSWAPTPIRTGRLTVGCKITWTWTELFTSVTIGSEGSSNEQRWFSWY